MNPFTELQTLLDLFPPGGQAGASGGLLAAADHVAGALTPEPYRTLLVHEHHMTVTMESFYETTVDVEILAQRYDPPIYSRKIVLKKHGTRHVVQFGIVRFDLSYVTPAVRDEILAGQTPLGRVLIRHNVLRHIDVGAILRIVPGPELAALFGCPPQTVTYGRLATIFCNHRPAVDLLEIAAPVPPGEAPAHGSAEFREPLHVD